MTTKARSLSYAPLRLRNQVINRWLTTGIWTRGVRFEPMTMEGGINDWLIKGFSIHENPCRKQFVDERRARTPELPFVECPVLGDSAEAYGGSGRWDLYMPWGNPRVEESGFYFVPTHLKRYACTAVVTPSAEKAPFRLKSCGGVALWVNGRLVCDFTPFTRNIEQTTEVEIALQAGENTFVICHEDLAERDTLYHFTLEYTGTAELEIRLPLPETLDAAPVLELEQALGQAYLPRDSVTDAEVRLVFERPFGHEKAFDITSTSFFDGKTTVRRVLSAGGRELVLGHTDTLGIEYKMFVVSASVGEATLRKPFGLEVCDARFRQREQAAATVAERKRIALECVAELGIPNIHTAIARLTTGGPAEAARELIESGLTGIRERRDCADFYLIVLFRLWRDYRESGLFDDAFWGQVRETILGFRYWIDEPGDDVMWFFSENHALLFHSCQLLAGQLFPEETFANSGETGEQRRAKAEGLLFGWFERFFAEGLAEWNSNAYIPIDVLGLVQLHDLAEHPELRNQAKRALDLLYSYMAAEAHNGYLQTTFGRSYEKELIGNRAAGTTSLLWVGYGTGVANSVAFNVSLYLSDYEPPQEYAALAKLEPGEELEFKLEQGKDGYAKLYHYRTAAFAMSSIADFRAGLKGYQEHVLHLAVTPEAQVWVNHPGEIYAHGAGRPCFWAGNGHLPKVGQYKGLGVLLFDADPGHDADYTHAYFPTYAFSRWERDGEWFFAERDGAYAAIFAANGLRLAEEGVTCGRELVSPGRRNVWIVRASDAAESGSYEAFKRGVLGMPVEASAGELRVGLEDAAYGEILFDWREPLRVNGAAVELAGSGVKGSLKRRKREAIR